MSLEQTIDNLQIRNANMVTFVGTSNTMVDTTTGRIQTKGIQHNSNVITDVSGPHGRGVATLKKYPEIDFDASKLDRNDSTNTYVQAGYTVTASTGYNGGTTSLQPWKVHTGIKGGHDFYSSETAANQGGTAGFIGTSNTYVGNSTLGGISGEWVKTRFPFPVKIKHVDVTVRDSSYAAFDWQSPSTFYIIGSHDGTTWSSALGTVTDRQYTASDLTERVILTNSEYYKYYAVVVTKVSGDRDVVSIDEIEYYGYEEDPPAGDHSVDTTFKSRFNNPQTTGVQVLVDGATGVGTNQISGGPDPSGNQSTYVTDGKYWTLNGTLTSNLSVEANTFLEGDQPHAVSVWFNSSNLEANVSNTCVFSIASEEKLDSVNLDLQSNTWHNMTYAYQGEGGSRVTYLDGRKVSEDQAEDTFGEYPPFAMTGYSQGGYVLSVDADHDGTNKIWKAFDGDDSSSSVWFSQPGTGDADSSYQAGYARGNPGQSVTDTNGTTHSGSWGKIEFPYKFVLNYVRVHGGTPVASYIPHNPDNYVILGSNDDTNWDLLTTRTGASDSSNGMTAGGTNIDQHPVNATKAYKYIKFLVTKLGSTSGDREFIIASLKLYGHRENDLVRLPDPTNVLKYPHITMTGPAQRGYTTRDAQLEVNNDTNQTRAWKAFRGTLVDNTDCYFGLYVSGSALYYNADGTWNSTSYPNVKLSSQTPAGDYITLGLPHKLVLNSFDLTPRNNTNTNQAANESADSFEIWGSNDNSTWYHINTYDNSTDQPSSITPRTFTVNWANSTATPNTPTAYKHIGLVVKKIFANLYSNNRQIFTLGRWRLYGTEEGSVPIQIGGGNIDKVANFRVYDRFIEEDQVNEIWNAQKEEFGRAKPQMVLQQGKLGIGTDAPQGSLSVADEPHNVEEFPPRAIPSTGPITPGNSKVYIDGHGTYEVLYPVAYPSHFNNATDNPLVLFDKTFNNLYSEINTFELNSAGATGSAVGSGNPLADPAIYTGNASGRRSLGGYEGIWYGLKFPFKVNLSQVHILSPASVTVSPNTAVFLGSEDGGVTWTKIGEFSGASWVAYKYNKYTLSHTKPINAAAIVITHSNHHYAANMSEMKFFGTREQGQSVLHDGQLTLTKSLNVPRIGPPLDADDTPRRDRLIVEYNTSSNPTFEGAVRDTSGRGNDGVFYGDVSYDANEKALEFPGSDDFIFTYVQNTLGAWKHSVSFWVKYDNTSTGMVFMMTKTGNTSGQANGSIGFSIAGGAFRYFFWGDDTDWNYSIQPGTLYHIVLTYDGGTANTSRKLYINGVDQGSPDARTSGQSGALDLETTTSQMKIGCGINNNEDLDGSVSNFKFYDCTLSAQEVKTLYDMGRNGSVANPQPLHIAAPLYAPGSIVQVQYASTPFNNTSRQTITGGELSDATNDIDYLDMNFKPKFANSSILLTAMINSTETHVASFGFKEDGTVVRTQANNTNATGAISTVYEGTNNNQHLKNNYIQVLIPANGTHTRRYNAAANSYWADVGYTLHINDRHSNDMRSISNMVVYEIAN